MEEGGRNAYSHLTCQNPQRLIPEVCLVTRLSAFRWRLGIRLASPKATAAPLGPLSFLSLVRCTTVSSCGLMGHLTQVHASTLQETTHVFKYLYVTQFFFFTLQNVSEQTSPGETDWRACARQSSLRMLIVKERLGCVKGLFLPKVYKVVISLVQVCRCQNQHKMHNCKIPQAKAKK